MRAPSAIAAFLLSALVFTGRSEAHVPMWAPRVSLSLALDWNKVAVEAIAAPRPQPPPRHHRHTIPKLTVTAAAPAPARLGLAAYGRVEGLVRDVVMPHYVAPQVDHRQKLRQLYFAPYTPYFGAYGFVVTVETDAVLH